MTNEQENGKTPPHEKPFRLPHEDWKEALREFLQRQHKGIRSERGDDTARGE